MPGIDLPLIRLFSIGIILGWFVRGLARRQCFIPTALVTFLLLSLIFLMSASLLVADQPLWGLRKIVFLLSFAPLFFVFAETLHEKPHIARFLLESLVRGATVAAAIALLQSLAQFVFGLEPVLALWRHLLPFFLGDTFGQAVADYPSLLVNIHGATVLRATAFFPDPHIAAYFFGINFCLAISLTLTPTTSKRWDISAILLLIADLLTFSRGGYLGLLAVLGFFLLWYGRKHLSPQRMLKNLALLGTLCGLLLLSPVGNRLLSSFSLNEGSNEGRLAMWRAAWEAMFTHPWLGVGLGNFSRFVLPTADYRLPIYAHNLFFDVAAESGILASLCLVGLLAFAGYALLQRSMRNPLFLGPAAALLLFGVHSLFETPLYSVHILPVVVFLLALGTLKPSANPRL